MGFGNKFRIEMYPIEGLVSVGQTDEQLIKSVELHWDEPKVVEQIKNKEFATFNVGTGALFIYFSCNIIMFRFKNKPLNDVIVHECFHATYQIMNRIGATLVDESEESYAYLIEYLYRTVYSLSRCKVAG